jgi:hypothetical protein
MAALGLDVLAVLVFVAIGRRSHDETGNAIVGALKVAAPFLIGLVVGWVLSIITVQGDRAPRAVRTGVVIWVSTVVIGLVLRRLVFDRGIALAFIIVATIGLGILINGWRGIARRRLV